MSQKSTDPERLFTINGAFTLTGNEEAIRLALKTFEQLYEDASKSGLTLNHIRYDYHDTDAKNTR